MHKVIRSLRELYKPTPDVDVSRSHFTPRMAPKGCEVSPDASTSHPHNPGCRVLSMAMAGLVSLGIASAPVHAQEDDSDIEEVIVTGSRLTQPNLVSPTAVNMLDSATIDLSGAINMSELLRTVPASGVSGLTNTNSNFTVGSSGLNTIEMRNLGEDRTLVLLNGRRFVAGIPGSQNVDFNTIPSAFIERIDVVTGGASAVYGSDALAGVINIITKKDFEGLRISVQSGISDRNDLEEHTLSITSGLPFADGRGHAMFSYTYDDDKGLYAREREGTSVDGLSRARWFTGDPDDWAESVIPFYSSFSELGRINIPNGGRHVLTDAGTVAPFSSAAHGFNRQAYRALLVPLERHLFSAMLDFQITDRMNFFSELIYSGVKSQSELEPFPMDSSDVYTALQRCSSATLKCSFGIPGTNPYIPEGMMAIARSNNPGIADEDLVFGFSRRMTELDQRGAYNLRQTFRQVIGIDGDFGDGFSYQLSANFGRTTQSQQSTGQINVLNMRYSLDSIRDADGNIICRDQIAREQGCIPVNIFGRGAITEGLDEVTRRNLLTYLKAPSARQAAVEQRIIGGFIAGDAFQMPAGAVRFAVGVEYRDERSESVGDALSQQGLNAGNAIPPTIGGYTVKESYLELEFPLLADEQLAQSLDLNVTARFSDYSTAGSTSAYAFSLKYVPINDIMLRTQYAEAVRAPNISELFAPLSQTFPTVSDPCAGVTRTSDGQAAFFNTRSNPNAPASTVLGSGIDAATIGNQTATTCLQDPHVAARVDATGGLALTQPEVQGVSGFNGGGGSGLRVETANTITGGIVWTPTFNEWITGFGISIDYYSIEIEDGIAGLPRGTALFRCYSAESYNPNSEFCSGIIRFSDGPSIGALRYSNLIQQNLSTLETSGIDIQTSYRFELPGDVGNLDITLTWGILESYETVAFAGDDPVDSTGTVGAPEHETIVGLIYSRPNLVVAWDTQIIGDSKFTNDEESYLQGAQIGAKMFHDIQVRYTARDLATVVAGVDNVTDEFVQIGFGLLGSTTPTGWNTAPAIYDGLGRRFYLGIRFDF